VRAALLVRPEPAHPVGPVGEWSAIASQLLRNAKTLRGWLTEAETKAPQVEEVFVSLFTDGLGYLYSDTLQEVDSPRSLLELPYFRQCKVLRAMEDLRPVLDHQEGCRLTRADADQVTRFIRSFVVDGRLGTTERRQVSQPTYEVFSHGDLHAANILVYPGKRPAPVIIDMNRFQRAHWASDIARLAVDLLLRSVDPGAESMFFSGFQTWRMLATQLGDRDTLGPAVTQEGGTASALVALNWLVGNLSAYCPMFSDKASSSEYAWEWHAALAVFLLRATYHIDVTAPKRALALVAAYDQLLCAAQCVPS